MWWHAPPIGLSCVKRGCLSESLGTLNFRWSFSRVSCVVAWGNLGHYLIKPPCWCRFEDSHIQQNYEWYSRHATHARVKVRRLEIRMKIKIFVYPPHTANSCYMSLPVLSLSSQITVTQRTTCRCKLLVSRYACTSRWVTLCYFFEVEWKAYLFEVFPKTRLVLSIVHIYLNQPLFVITRV